MNRRVNDLNSFWVELDPRKAFKAGETLHLRIYAINRLSVVQCRSRDHHLDSCKQNPEECCHGRQTLGKCRRAPVVETALHAEQRREHARRAAYEDEWDLLRPPPSTPTVRYEVGAPESKREHAPKVAHLERVVLDPTKK